jgi:hypothetical protein
MKKLSYLGLGLLALTLSIPAAKAVAGGTAEQVEIKFDDAVKNFQDKKGRHLDGSVKFYWAAEKAPAKGGDELSARGMTMQRGEQEERCAKALASALITFQERAKKEGHNAVVDIRTYYDADTKSDSRDKCLCIGGRSNTRTTVKGRLADVK